MVELSYSERDRKTMAKAESISAVDYFVDTYGQERLVKLIDAFGEGDGDAAVGGLEDLERRDRHQPIGVARIDHDVHRRVHDR